MTVQDINSLRPSYLNRVHQLDFHWSVWNTKTGEEVMLFVKHKGTNKGYFTAAFDPLVHDVWYWDHYEHCVKALGLLSKEPWTIHEDAVKAGIPTGNYKCSITRVNGQKLVSYEFTV